jgi:hypothetical protein
MIYFKCDVYGLQTIDQYFTVHQVLWAMEVDYRCSFTDGSRVAIIFTGVLVYVIKCNLLKFLNVIFITVF